MAQICHGKLFISLRQLLLICLKGMIVNLRLCRSEIVCGCLRLKIKSQRPQRP